MTISSDSEPIKLKTEMRRRKEGRREEKVEQEVERREKKKDSRLASILFASTCSRCRGLLLADGRS